jgi:regulation of enolase protein 1 (concanavalin A-like superfamily)
MQAFGSPGWQWLNPPPSSAVHDDGLTVTTGPDSDFWRTTHYGFVRDTGHSLLRPVPGDFTISATFSGGYTHLYDQAGLLLRLDAANWIKTGIEYVDGEQLLSVVVTREVSDWSVVALPVSPGSVTIVAERAGDTVTVKYGLDGADPVRMARLAYFPPEQEVHAGVMAASPQGPGFTVRFDGVAVVA